MDSWIESDVSNLLTPKDILLPPARHLEERRSIAGQRHLLGWGGFETSGAHG